MGEEIVITDQEWANIIKWLGARGMHIVIPLKGRPYIEHKSMHKVRRFKPEKK